MRQIAEKLYYNNFAVNGANYSLRINHHLITVMVENTPFAVLDIRCAAPKTNDDDTGFIADEEPSIPALIDVQINDGTAIFTWKNKSSLWDKTYTLTCTWMRYTFDVTLHGHGRVDSVKYFIGDMSAQSHGSSYEFSDCLLPCAPINNADDYTFKSSVNCHRLYAFMVPPMLCYSFRCEGISRRLGLGLVAERGEHNFHNFDYMVSNAAFHSGFYLETDQAGHVTVDGEWTAPHIIGFSGDDQWEVFKQYSDYYFSSGIATPRSNKPIPRFWHGPLACGWLEQNIVSVTSKEQTTSQFDSSETLYEGMVEKFKKYDLNPSAIILDDKWQSCYATNVADPEKFPDMRAFVDRRHAEDMKVMLWFKLWDKDGWKEELCVKNDKGDLLIDPSHPEFISEIDSQMHRLLSSDEGCYDCDGLKIDYAFMNPVGRNVHTYSGKYGIELMYDIMEHIYTRAKLEKADAVINCSPCHPYFSHICDQARIHDYDAKNRDNKEDLSMRARYFSIAMPGVLIDTDNAGFTSRRDTLRWLLSQQNVGIPDLYAVTPTPDCNLDEADFAAISQVWKEYSAKIDSLYDNK